MATEKRLINGNKLAKAIMETAEGLADCDQQNAAWALRKYAIRDIAEASTVDAVEVVRCKDCKHWDSDFLWCDRKNVRMVEDDFCSYGERCPDA